MGIQAKTKARGLAEYSTRKQTSCKLGTRGGGRDMSPNLLEFNPSAWNVGLAAIGLFSLLFSGVSRISKERLFLSEPSVAVGAGALVERALNLKERLGDMVLRGESAAPEIVREVSRTVIGIQVFTTAIELPRGYFTSPRNLQSVLVALFPVMMATWAIVLLLTFGIMGSR
ncbi:hypothetical protein DUNSADRAFT_14257 [Dunaliella salina]|uniref:ABC transporter permease n=1 Tax=Dunaliella salina TaxID=3046 RepID=A0ABQ7G7M7_DUNSA|nr:hypothetical protein DUNSADRAFT_14257 [Dunaliella salina]|eukprot:KAF5830610.1 hypothetical protein DUNSADRAFT_14257 [Dunaliella salina]